MWIRKKCFERERTYVNPLYSYYHHSTRNTGIGSRIDVVFLEWSQASDEKSRAYFLNPTKKSEDRRNNLRNFIH